MDFESSYSLKRSINLNIFGCLGNERPNDEFNDSSDDVVRMFRPHTDIGSFLF